MPALTSLLVRDQVASIHKIEEALQRQVLEGGEIDTILLELGAVPENVLNAYRAALFNLAPASRHQLMSVGPQTLAKVPKEIAERFRVVPIAFQNKRLQLGISSPLPDHEIRELMSQLRVDLEFRVTTEVRVEAALAAHYGIEISGRLRLLALQLEKTDPGALPTVTVSEEQKAIHFEEHFLDEFWSETLADEGASERNRELGLGSDNDLSATSEPSAKRTSRRVLFSDGEAPGGFQEGETLKGVEPPTPSSSAVGDEQTTPRDTESAIGEFERDIPDGGFIERKTLERLVEPVESPRTVGMSRVVGIGERILSQEKGDAAAADIAEQPMEDEPAKKTSLRSQRRYAPRGPLTPGVTRELLESTDDRDSIIELFFSFAKQYFDCAVLLAFREDCAVGLEANGYEGGEDIRAVKLPLAKRGMLEDLQHSLLPRVTDLTRRKEDRDFLSAFGRSGIRPVALLPICIRQRVVLLLYGDRAGEHFTLDDLTDVITLLQPVGRAFERMIHISKVLTSRLRRSSDPTGTPASPASRPTDPSDSKEEQQAAPEAFATDGSQDEPPDKEGIDAAKENRLKEPDARPARRAAPKTLAGVPSEKAVVQLREGAFRTRKTLSGVVTQERLSKSDDDSREEDKSDKSTTVSQNRASDALDDGRSTSSKTLTGLAGGQSLGSAGRTSRHRVVPGHEERGESSSASDDAENAANLYDDLDWGDTTETQNEPSDAVTDQKDEGETSADSVPHQPAPPDDGSQSPLAAAQPSSEAAISDTSDQQAASESARTPVISEMVRWSDPPKESVARNEPEPDKRHSQPIEEKRIEPSIVVDMGLGTDALLEKLCSSSPGEEARTVSMILQAGDEILDELELRFPGPLWFNRKKPFREPPPGRDVSAVSRAIIAFGNKAVPHIRSLLFSNDPEKRFYAVLLAGDVRDPSLLEPLGQRLFDADPQTRNATLDVFRKYRNVQGFSDSLKSLRHVASSPDRPVDMRVIALQALAEVRDTESFDVLLNLLQYAEDAVANMARRVLVVLTVQDFGLSVRKWAAWIKRNRSRDRIEWLIEGLTHSDETIREAAGTELQKMTGEYYGFHPTLPKRDRERIQKKYRSWWKERRI